MKTCSKCKIEKEECFFYKNSKYKDGYLNQCKECNCSLRKERYAANREQELLRSSFNYDPVKNKQKYLKNKDKIKQWSKEYYLKNKRSIYIKCSLNRKERIKRATLPGFTTELIQIYKNRPNGYHVDHIVPLQGKTVCGLHVPWNLQIITAEENLSKSNKLYDDSDIIETINIMELSNE